jgi:hypothetical protein
MNYHSQDKSIKKAFNQTWLLIGFPFFIIMFTTFILGFVLIDHYKLTGNLYPFLTIITGILLPTIICHQISKIWFSYQIERVSDKAEFTERAKRNQMIWPSTADKILKAKGIILQDRIELKEQILETITIDNVISISAESIEIDGEIFFWKDIRDFRITANQNIGLSNYTLFLIFSESKFFRKELSLIDSKYTEFLIDKYLTNYRYKYLPH